MFLGILLNCAVFYHGSFGMFRETVSAVSALYEDDRFVYCLCIFNDLTCTQASGEDIWGVNFLHI